MKKSEEDEVTAKMEAEKKMEIKSETKSEENQLKIAIPVLDMVTTNYENALRELGAQPVVIKEVCDPQEYDGLLLPGGDDVDPARFGQEINGSL